MSHRASLACLSRRSAHTLNLSKFPRQQLTFGPTPIVPLPRLSKHLGGNVDIYAKREDCNSGLAFGGNKTRKLEYLIPDALEGGYDTLVSIGGIQSNQTRQVAAVAAHLGLKCVLVQEDWVNYSDAVYDRVGNIQLSRIMGADVRLDEAGFDIGIRKSWQDALDEVEQAGGKPFPIPAGCSVHPKGGLGFVGFAEEVRQQEAELGFKFDYIVVCAVTGSTQAGMVVGFAADGRERRVIGVDASAKPAQTHAQVLEIAQSTAKLVELDRDITADDVILDERFGGPEYGIPNEGTLEAIRLCARQEGMLTDPVYEGKSMHGMIEMILKGELQKGSKVLYAHLGGVPALSAYSFLFRNG
ncbi:1-aminocyclopropane-1-carboxylate deaminase [Rhizodiscina lignyota]|uniref:1-aminocyclopropane-1-carboxylate deaminase n=1 Tax=Rhizodiscina lignyota TaxID=1504668 RepID=A0A9P4ILA0_9PEZI|nr:1-aminocyclopropane-1-carboxylate deaminase [Rhizodiscina lignyota]